MTAKSDQDRLLRMAERQGTLTAGEATRAGIHSQLLTRLVADGTLERVGRGTYRLADQMVTEGHAFALVSAAAPHGVLCLLSALSFHEIGTQLPTEVWLAIERGTRAPRMKTPTLRICRFGGAAFHEGVEIRRVEGRDVRVYSVAKTLADLFKYRSRIGLDVAIEALRETWGKGLFTMEALDRAARVCRVYKVMRPYVEGVVA